MGTDKNLSKHSGEAICNPDEKTWLDEYHDAMKAVCEGKRRKTKGKCEEWECYGLGWCNECLEAVKEGKQ